MKSIGVVIYGVSNSLVSESINNNLKDVFGESVIIQNYIIKELGESDIIDNDVILVLENEKISILQPFIRNMEKIIMVDRTFRKDDITKIFEIKRNSEVLVVNSTRQSTLDTVEHLYQITNNYLNFIPYESHKIYDNIKIAITPGEAQFVPNFIEKVVDVKNRCLSTYTFIRMINKLNIDDKKIFGNLMAYSEHTVDINSSINRQYKELYIKNAILENITEKLNEGIIVTNNNYDILYRNKKVEELLNIKDGAYNLKDIFEQSDIYLNNNGELFEYNSKKILMSKTRIKYYENQEDYLFDFKEDLYIKDLGNALNNELKKKGLIAKYYFKDIMYVNKKMGETVRFAKKIALSEYSVMITGETGTGKEVFAQAIHNYSDRKYGPFVAVNCAALPENLLESELFGYEKGAFTGANKEGKIGLFEQANTGTVFLDEIGDMPVALQSRLLRVLQERQILRLGSDKIININVRIIAATNQDINMLIKSNKFRRDLLYRLNTFHIHIQPLRDRKEDILFLLEKFTQSKSNDLPDEFKNMLIEYEWEGNVREIINVSNYINLVGNDIPDYLKINIHNQNFGMEINSLSQYELYNLLNILENYKNKETTVGREKMLDEMKHNRMRIGEHRLKNAISEMREKGLIEVSIGRNGTTITSYGSKCIKILESMHVI